VILPDGSTAWLNAASSIRFPTSFTNKREVQTTGEVYFDIAPDAAKPFYVSSGAVNIQVLGTEFDIQNYNNEPSARVTLVTGSVKVLTGQQHRILSGQQQAKLTPEAPITIVGNPDISQAIAWKTGFFRFKNADIRSIMREVERWYDVEVEYHVTDNAATYGGRISRGLPLSQLLRLLQGNNIHHYKMEGRKLIILP
jgi:ferric-dicitrate binding protein FerR (iron transport regulator)